MDHFTEEQPKDGDTMLHCDHIKGGGKCHFFKISETAFTRPDGTSGTSHWIMLCDACFQAHGETKNFQITGDSQWVGDEPEIKINPDMN